MNLRTLGVLIPNLFDGRKNPEQMTSNPELEMLRPLPLVFIQREPEELLGLHNWFNKSKKYKILNEYGQQVLVGSEESGQSIWKGYTGFRFIDKYERDVFTISYFFDNRSREKLVINDCYGDKLGSLVQNFSVSRYCYTVLDSNNTPMLKIRGPPVHCITNLAKFQITSRDEQSIVGCFSKNWIGSTKEFFKYGKTFVIRFPPDSDVRTKVILIGICLYLDFSYYHLPDNNRSRLGD